MSKSRSNSPAHAALASRLLLATALAACSSVGSSSPSGDRSQDVGATAGNVKEGGTLTMALSAEPDFLDPTLAGSFYSRYVFNAMCEKLYDLNANVRIVPQLAASLPTTSKDGKTVTIKLRQGVKFADGTTMDSSAVKISLERDLNNPQSARVTELGPITSIDTPDASTVVIHLKTPFAPLTAALADRSGMVMSPTQLKKLGDKFGTDPVCVGPFKFADRVPQNSITLVKDPNYYDADKVHLDKIVYRIITDSAIRAANLKSGDVQVADTVGTNDVSSIKSDSSLQMLESSSLGYQGLTFNVGNTAGVGKPTRHDPGAVRAGPADPAGLRVRHRPPGAGQDRLRRSVRPRLRADRARQPVQHPGGAEVPSLRPRQGQAAAPAGRRTGAVPAEHAGHQHARHPAVRPGAPGDGQARGVRPEAPAAGVHHAARPAGPGQVPAPPAGLVRSGRPGRQHHELRRHAGLAERRGLQQPEGRPAAGPGPRDQDVAQRAKLYGEVQTQTQKDDPIIYIYRQRNLTGVSKDVSGVQVYPDGIIRVAFAGYTK